MNSQSKTKTNNKSNITTKIHPVKEGINRQIKPVITTATPTDDLFPLGSNSTSGDASMVSEMHSPSITNTNDKTNISTKILTMKEVNNRGIRHTTPTATPTVNIFSLWVG